MSAITDILTWAIQQIAALVKGQPAEPLEGPLGQLQSEKAKQDLDAARAARQAKDKPSGS